MTTRFNSVSGRWVGFGPCMRKPIYRGLLLFFLPTTRRLSRPLFLLGFKPKLIPSSNLGIAGQEGQGRAGQAGQAGQARQTEATSPLKPELPRIQGLGVQDCRAWDRGVWAPSFWSLRFPGAWV